MTVVWFTGLPASGKTTLARRVAAALTERGTRCCLLDSDEVRAALVPAHGYDEAGRDDFYATLARLAALLARQGTVVLVAATAHDAAYRNRARDLSERFIEVYVATPLDACVERDPKGLYRRAREGDAATLPGASLRYDVPASPEVTAEGGNDLAALGRIVALL